MYMFPNAVKAGPKESLAWSASLYRASAAATSPSSYRELARFVSIIGDWGSNFLAASSTVMESRNSSSRRSIAAKLFRAKTCSGMAMTAWAASTTGISRDAPGAASATAAEVTSATSASVGTRLVAPAIRCVIHRTDCCSSKSRSSQYSS